MGLENWRKNNSGIRRIKIKLLKNRVNKREIGKTGTNLTPSFIHTNFLPDFLIFFISSFVIPTNSLLFNNISPTFNFETGIFLTKIFFSINLRIL